MEFSTGHSKANVNVPGGMLMIDTHHSPCTYAWTARLPTFEQYQQRQHIFQKLAIVAETAVHRPRRELIGLAMLARDASVTQ